MDIQTVHSLPRASVLVPPRECVLVIWCLQNSELVINTTVRAGIIIFDLSDNMAQNTIICGFVSIIGLKWLTWKVQYCEVRHLLLLGLIWYKTWFFLWLILENTLLLVTCSLKLVHQKSYTTSSWYGSPIRHDWPVKCISAQEGLCCF